MGVNAQASRRAIQHEVVPLLLGELYKLMSRNKVEEAIEYLDTFKITNDCFKEHLMDLCVNKKTIEAFDKLTTQ